MSGKIPGGLPCEPCMMATMFGKPGEAHPCTGNAASPVDGPCPCCPPVPMPKFCGCCDQPIRAGEPYTTHEIDRPTGAGLVVYLHVERCKRKPTQTAPVLIRH